MKTEALLFPRSWRWGERPHPEHAICAMGDKIMERFCFRVKGHSGKHRDHDNNEW